MRSNGENDLIAISSRQPDPERLHQLRRDAENRITTTLGYTYTYDANGKRIRKQAGNDWTEYIYFGGQVIAEKDQAGAWTDYIFAGSKRVAKAPGVIATSGTQYYHSDHLGSARLMTDASGNPVPNSDATFLQFGQEFAATTAGNHYKFTGKERDAESGLDYYGARYYGSNIGRFTSVDPMNIKRDRLFDPQRLNLYSYVRNNPLAYTDPDGRDLQLGTGPDQKSLVKALVDIARKPGGLALLKKLDDSKVVFKLNTVGKGELGGTGNYGVMDPKGTSAPKGTNDVSGTANINFDFQQRKEDKGMADAGVLDKSKVPASDGAVVGHELTHGEEFLKDPQGYSKTPEAQREAQADSNAANITGQKNELSEKEAKAEVEKLLKPKEEKK